MLHAYRRLLVLFGVLVLTLVLSALLYQIGMSRLEGEERNFWRSLGWAAETLTTTGYGSDDRWSHPVMVVFVIAVQFFGLVMTIAVVPVLLIPWFESRFEPRLARTLPDLRDFVLIYHWGPAVSGLVHELDRRGITWVVVEEDEGRARWLRDHEHRVVFVDLEESQFDLRGVERCRALIAAGADHDNASLIAGARHRGYRGPAIALVGNPRHTRPLTLAGANLVCSPLHSLASALAARASDRIAPRVAGMEHLGGEIELAELRVTSGSGLAGKTLADLDLRGRTGATVVGQWAGSGPAQSGHFGFLGQAHGRTVIEVGAIVVALGTPEALGRLGEWATPLLRGGPIVVFGQGALGQHLVEMLEAVDESVRVVARDPHPRVDVLGDALDPEVLDRVGLDRARAVVLAFSDDSTTLFATTILRDRTVHVPIIAAVDRAENASRIRASGADVALSISEVTGDLLGRELFGAERAGGEVGIRVFAATSIPFEGLSLAAARIPERSGCTVVAIDRAGGLLADLSGDTEVEPGDVLLLVGPREAIERFEREFGSSNGQKPR